MTDEVIKLKAEADHYKFLYSINKVSREEAKEHIQPYLDAINNKAKELAKKYNQRYKPVTFGGFVR